MATIKIGLDARTSFPCIELPRTPGHFVALLPLTKMQVEQFICEADIPQGWTMADLYGRVAELTSHDYGFTDTYRVNGEESRMLTDMLRRTALAEMGAPEAILAGNIPFAHPNFEDATDVFPTSGTLAASTLAWLGAGSGDQPARSLPTAVEYDQIRETYGNASRDYLQAVLTAYETELAPRTRRILKHLLKNERIGSKQHGLPFLEGGLWELTGQSAKMDTLGGRNFGKHIRPLAIGMSPYLSRFYKQETGPRRILVPSHPCITMRPVFPQTALCPGATRTVNVAPSR